jgi:Tol biopolymer transport system component
VWWPVFLCQGSLKKVVLVDSVAKRWRLKVLTVGAATLLAAVLLAGAAYAAGTTARVNLTSTGAQADDTSRAASISDNGRHVAFQSWASNLVPNDEENFIGIYARDITARKTTRLDVTDTGEHGNSLSSLPSISSNGRFVAYESSATNLVAGDTNAHSDVFVRDRDTDADGVLDEPNAVDTERASVSDTEQQTGFLDWSERPTISANGRYVAFVSDAANLVSGDTNGHSDVFVRDLVGGKTVRVSVSTSGSQATGSCSCSGPEVSNPFVSATGRYIVFSSGRTNLVNGDTNGTADVFRRDRDTDADGVMDEPGAVSTTRVSLSNTGAQGTAESYFPSISSNGRYVAFTSNAGLVAGDTGGGDVFVRDRTAAKTTKMSVTTAGTPGNGASGSPRISAAGRFVVFTSIAPNLVGTGSTSDVVMRDRDTDKDGVMDESGAVLTTNESLSATGAQPNGNSGAPAINNNGRYIAFDSAATNLISGDTNAKEDVFRRDRGAQ